MCPHKRQFERKSRLSCVAICREQARVRNANHNNFGASAGNNRVIASEHFPCLSPCTFHIRAVRSCKVVILEDTRLRRDLVCKAKTLYLSIVWYKDHFARVYFPPTLDTIYLKCGSLRRNGVKIGVTAEQERPNTKRVAHRPQPPRRPNDKPRS